VQEQKTLASDCAKYHRWGRRRCDDEINQIEI
jgi:hypothetical protein